MDFLPIIQQVGAPAAIAIFLLWKQGKMADAATAEHAAAAERHRQELEKASARIDSMQDAGMARERQFAEAFHKASRYLADVVARNNLALDALRRHLERDESTADTRIISALKTPPPAETPFPFPRSKDMDHG